jgi:hypothetical protein
MGKMKCQPRWLLRFTFRLAALLILSAPTTHAGVIVGQVLGSQGVGVPGVDIDVKNLGSGGTPDIFNDGTDANGFFATTVPDGVYLVTFKPPAPPVSSDLTLFVNSQVIVGTTNMGVLTLPAGVAVSGRLVTSQGFPVSGVGLDAVDALTGANLPLNGDTTSVFGEFAVAIPANPVQLQFLPKNIIGLTLAARSLGVNLAVDTDLGDILLEDGHVVTVTVTNAAGLGLVGIDTDAFNPALGEDMFTPGDNTGLGGVVSVVLPDGDYEFAIEPTVTSSLVAQALPLTVAGTDVNLGSVALQPGSRLSGLVSKANGSPFQGVDVDVKDPLTGLGLHLVGDHTTAAGIYQVIVPPGVWNVEFEPPVGLPYAIVIVPDVLVSGSTVLSTVLPDCPLPCGPAAIHSIFPANGHPTGNQPLTVTGQNFRDDGSIIIFIGGKRATVTGVIEPDTAFVLTPSGKSGATVNVGLASSNGPALLVGGFTFDDPPPPVLTSVEPATGLFHTPGTVTLHGLDFDPFFDTVVRFAGVLASDVTRVDAQTMSCVPPAGAQGQPANVIISQDGDASLIASAFTWVGTSIASLSPAGGHPAIQTPVTITGTLIAPDSTVLFGGVPASVTTIDATSISVLAPVGAPGSVVSLTVSGSDGTDTLAGAFTYADPAPPALASLSPAVGLFHTPPTVTLSGTDFDPYFPTSVRFGGQPALDVTWIDAATITCTPPPGAQGALADVELTQGVHGSSLPAAYGWIGTHVDAVSPAIGHPGLPTPATITGTFFAPDSSVSFGAQDGTVLSVTSTSMDVVAPPAPAGTIVAIIVTGTDGTDTLAGGFSYEDPPAPVLAGTTPSAGVFHNPATVTLDGSDFDAFFPITVSFGGLPAIEVVRLSDSLLTCTPPANLQGSVGDIVLTQNGHATSLPGGFTWFGTMLSSLSPANGHPAVETLVTLTGEHIAPGTEVHFGSQPATVVLTGSTSLTVLAPTSTPGSVVDVTLTGADGTDTLTGAFTYDDPPASTLLAVSPASGLFHTPQPVSITGTDFDPFFSLSITLDGVPATQVVRVSDSLITALLPAGVQGETGDLLLSQGGQTAELPAAYGWIGTSITSLSPTGGHPAVETPVTIQGSFFAADSVISFGGQPVTVLAIDATSAQVLVPPGLPGASLDLSLSGSDGTASLPEAFTYDDPPPPTLAAISPNAGLFHAPLAVSVTGTGFDAFFPLSLSVGGLPVSQLVRVSDTALSGVVPANAQDSAGDVVLTQNGQSVTLGSAYHWEGAAILAVAPTKGNPNGGTAVTITGEHFVDDGSMVVSFGGTAATLVSVSAPSSLVVITPAGSPGAVVDVHITGSNGTDTRPGGFTFVDPLAPTLLSVSPASALFHQTTPITLTGADFDPLASHSLSIGGSPATELIVVSPTEVRAVAPTGLQGQVGDVVLVQDGKMASLGGAFRWLGTQIASLSTDQGHPALQTPVTLTGTFFAADSMVSFGGASASVLAVTSTRLDVLAPVGTSGESVDVTVSGSDGTHTLPDAFRWETVPAPILAGLDPSEGLFHTPSEVRLSGADFDPIYPISVSFGDAPATQVVFVSPVEVRCVPPLAAQGDVGDVVVTQNGESSTLAGAFRWIGTELTAVAPASGHPSGGTRVTLTGERFAQDGSTEVRFGGALAVNVTVLSEQTLTTDTPPGQPGLTVDVTVSGTDGEGGLLGGFVYDDPLAPALTSVTPSSALFHTPTPVTIQGGSFDSLASLEVRFGELPATQVSVLSPTQIACIAPAGLQGQVVDLSVTQDGHLATLSQAFGYVGMTLVSLDPPSVAPVGGSAVTLSGTFFPEDGSLEVRFGELSARVLSVSIPDTALVMVPVGLPGATLDVGISSTHGTSLLPKAFTYAAATLLAVSPDVGPAAGGPPATLIGEHLPDDGSLKVFFGALPAQLLSVDPPSSATVEIPPGTRGSTVDVSFSSTNGDTHLPAAFTYAITALASAAPAIGAPGGGETVVLLGDVFVDDATTQVFFGDVEAELLAIEAPHTLRVVAPPGSPDSTVDITVMSSNGLGVLSAAYTYGDFSLFAGDGVDGSITAGDTDTLFFEALSGSRITLLMKRGKGSSLEPGFRLFAPDDSLLVSLAASVAKTTVARVKNFELPQTGRYRLELGSVIGNTGSYRFRSKVRHLTKFTTVAVVNAATPQHTISFGAFEGWQLKSAKVASKKSKQAPEALLPSLALIGPGGELTDLAPFTSANKTGTKLNLSGVPLDQFGTWRLELRGAEGSAGQAKVSVRLKAPKQPKQVLLEP